MSVCKETPKKNVQLVNCPSENTAIEIFRYLLTVSPISAIVPNKLDTWIKLLLLLLFVIVIEPSGVQFRE